MGQLQSSQKAVKKDQVVKKDQEVQAVSQLVAKVVKDFHHAKTAQSQHVVTRLNPNAAMAQPQLRAKANHLLARMGLDLLALIKLNQNVLMDLFLKNHQVDQVDRVDKVHQDKVGKAACKVVRAACKAVKEACKAACRVAPKAANPV